MPASFGPGQVSGGTEKAVTCSLARLAGFVTLRGLCFPETPKFPSLRREALAVTEAVLDAVRELRQAGFPALPAAGALSVRLTAALETAAADPSHDLRAAAAAAGRALTQLGQ